jgi:hypothetical protein
MFFGPFQIIECILNSAYKLQLLEGVHIHDVFHVGLLKRYVGDKPVGPGTLPPIHHGRTCFHYVRNSNRRSRLETVIHYVCLFTV